tara:strand:+ start:1725 stop:2114 length:390 start_codon:yes stop_codon:yes gene_type:complete
VGVLKDSFVGSDLAVIVTDEATGGCWTNIAETRSHLISKLESRGHKIVYDRNEAKFRFDVNVLSERTSGDFCYGVVEVQLYQFSYDQDGFFSKTYGSSGSIFVRPNNVNLLVLEVIDKFVAELDGEVKE